MQETWIQFLGQEDPLEKRIAIHSNSLAWRIPWTEKTGGLQSVGPRKVGHNWVINTFTFLSKEYISNILTTEKVVIIM